MRRLLFFCIAVFTTLAFSSDTLERKKYPQDYFRSPVNHTIRLSGTFGELRPNHFHSGIDIKSSNGSAGDPLYAIADGFVSRVKVQAGGYGNALYITHPNGYISVYAHMHEFTPALEKYIKKAQYRNRSFSVDLNPTKDQFAFKKGDKIGLMGNSGSSFGPHLHFEIRDAGTQKPINPLLFGFKMADHRAPKMHQLKVYFLNDKREATTSKIYDLSQAGRNYRIKGDTLTLGAWRAGFGLKVYDHHDNVTNWNGIYSLEMFQDGKLVYDFDFETFSFSETRYINAHMDYKDRVTKKAYFNRCYELPGNHLSIYNEQLNHGVIPLHRNKTSEIRLVAKDADGNTSELKFWVKRGEVKALVAPETFNYVLDYKEANVIRQEQFYLNFPKGALYENLYLKYQTSPKKSNLYYSNIHHIQDYKTPVHRYFEIGIKPTASIPPNLKNKAFIAYFDKNGGIENCGGTWQGEKLQTKVRQLGDYAILVDEVPPTIKPISFQSNMKGWNKMSFKIKDNYPSAGKARGLSFKATVDGAWILLEHDGKNDLLIHRFDDRIAPGEHQLKLVVEDNRGNQTVFERKIIR